MERNTHYFYALKLPVEIKLHLQKICTSLKDELPFKSWVHHEDYHVTLAFLGNADPKRLLDSIQYVRKAVTAQPSFPLMIDHLGVFGKSDSPRIFWAGTEKSQDLHHLRGQVFQACQKSGFILETRPFHPHITLARRWSGTNSFKPDFLEKIEILDFHACEVVLYETHLEKVPKYEVKETFLLSK